MRTEVKNKGHNYRYILHKVYTAEVRWKEQFIQFTVRVFRERLSVCVCSSFPFVFEGGMWILIILIPDHCLSIYF